MKAFESKERKKIGLATFILAVTFLLSNLLGILRDRLLTTKFPTFLLDAYFAAFRLPDLIYNFLILGAIGSVFVPIFTRYITKNQKEEAFLVANSLINVFLIVLTPLTLFLIISAPLLMKFIVPGFDPQRFALTVSLTRILLLSPILFALSGVFGSILNSFKEFLFYSLSPLVYNLAIILGILFFSEKWGIFGVAYAVIAGAFLHFLIPFLKSFKYGYFYKPVLDLAHSGLKSLGKMVSWRSVNLLTTQLVFYTYTFIASFLAAGSNAIVTLAYHIQTFPILFFSASLSSAFAPFISEKISKEEKEKIAQEIGWIIKQSLFFIIPATLGLILLRAQLVRLILGSQIFTWQDTQLTVAALLLFAISIPFQGMLLLLSQIFYVFLDAKTPGKIGIFSSLLNILLAFILVQPFFVPYFRKIFSIKGDVRVLSLPLAFSLAMIINALLLFYFLKEKIKDLNIEDILHSLTKTTLLSIIMGVFVWRTLYFVSPLVNMQTFKGIFLQALTAILVGIIVFLTGAFLLKMEEVAILKVLFRKFLFFKKE